MNDAKGKIMNKKSEMTGMEVAVIGMSLRFPGADNTEEFWNNLKNGVESVKVIKDEELRESGVSEELINNPSYVKAGVSIKGKEYFDSKFFDYRKEEALLMNPQLKIFHQCVWEALEDSGYDPEIYDGLIGLYAGAKSDINWENYSHLFHGDTGVDEMSCRIYRKVDYICSLIAYKLNLKGPAVFINTACSTSLVAIHTATMSLLTGECNIAIAGGITLSSSKPEGYMYKEGMINSPDGHCRAFDNEAKGIVPGEGAGVVVLKKLDKAIQDGDNIHAVIKGSAINNDGNRKVGYTAPAVTGQANVIRAAQIMSGVKPETISYIEAHGTGTFLGDPVEIEALSQAFPKSEEKYCAIGSVKSNFGHADSAAGVAGFIKTVLAMKNRQIPATLHFQRLNDKISLEHTPFKINTKLSDWKNGDKPLRAGVSSFGIGGTNAHVILEEAPERERTYESETKPQLLVFSAKSSDSLKKTIGKYIDFIRENNNINLSDLAWTLQSGRAEFQYRLSLVADSVQKASYILMEKEASDEAAYKVEGQHKPIVFLLSEEDSLPSELGRELYENEPLFRKKAEECFAILDEILPFHIREILYPNGDNITKPNGREYHNSAMFIVKYALTGLLKSWGINPDYIIGDGVGEYVAACYNGLFSAKEAITLLLGMDETINFCEPDRLWISATTGYEVDVQEVMEKKYWLNNSHKISSMIKGMETVLKSNKDSIFLEIGWSNNNTVYASNKIQEFSGKGIALELMKHAKNQGGEIAFLLEQIGKLWMRGIKLNWKNICCNEMRCKISAPTYSFEKRKYPLAINMNQFLNKHLSNLNENKETTIGEEIASMKETMNNNNQVESNITSSIKEGSKKVYSETEEVLLRLWEEFFEVSDLGINDNFFEIGGDSLRAMELASIIESRFQLEISIEQLFNLTTVAEMADYIDSNKPQEERGSEEQNIENGVVETERFHI